MKLAVALTSDENYFLPLCTALNSIERNWRSSQNSFDYIILDCGLEPWQISYLSTLGATVRFHQCEINPLFAGAIQTHLYAKYLVPATFARYELFRLIQDWDYDKILLVDSDALVVKNCDAVWDITDPFAARWSPGRHITKQFNNDFEASLRANNDPFLSRILDPAQICFNAGVFLVNKDPIHEFLYKRLVEVTLKYLQHLKYVDQGALNYVVIESGIIGALPAEYNVDSRIVSPGLENVSILHYLGYLKPWNSDFLDGRPEFKFLLDLWMKYQPTVEPA